jgi:hypothetical protein
MKNTVFWDVALCRSCVNQRFGGTYRLHLQGKKIRERGTSVSRWLKSADFSTLKMKAIRSSETSVHTRSTQRHIQNTAFFNGGIAQPFFISALDGGGQLHALAVLFQGKELPAPIE